MPTAKKKDYNKKLTKNETTVLKHKALQLKHLFEKMGELDLEKEINKKRDKYERSLHGKK